MFPTESEMSMIFRLFRPRLKGPAGKEEGGQNCETTNLK